MRFACFRVHVPRFGAYFKAKCSKSGVVHSRLQQIGARAAFTASNSRLIALRCSIRLKVAEETLPEIAIAHAG